MTISIKVTNNDRRESAVIGVFQQNLDTNGKVVTENSVVELKGGKSHDCDIHSAQQIVVKEIRE